MATRRLTNKKRTKTGGANSLISCPRLDGIFSLILPDYELGTCEIGKDGEGPEGTKRIEDFRKLVSTMGHILLRLHEELEITRPDELRVIGFVCSGMSRPYPPQYRC